MPGISRDQVLARRQLGEARTLVKRFAHDVVRQLEHTPDDNRVTVGIEASQEPSGRGSPGTAAKNHFSYTASDDLGRSTGNPVFRSDCETALGGLGEKSLMSQLRTRGDYLRGELGDCMGNPQQHGVQIGYKQSGRRWERTKSGYKYSIEVYTARRTDIGTPLEFKPG
jgi:hypothetical protein